MYFFYSPHALSLKRRYLQKQSSYATTRQVTPRQGTDRMGSGSTKPTAIDPSEMPNTYHKP